METISPEKTLTTRFGGITAISLFGPKAVDAFLLPVATEFWQSWETTLTNKAIKEEERVQLQQCQQALMVSNGFYPLTVSWRKCSFPFNQISFSLLLFKQSALSVFFKSVNPSEIVLRLERNAFVDTFGERLIPLQNEPADYTMCFV